MVTRIVSIRLPGVTRIIDLLKPIGMQQIKKPPKNSKTNFHLIQTLPAIMKPDNLVQFYEASMCPHCVDTIESLLT